MPPLDWYSSGKSPHSTWDHNHSGMFCLSGNQKYRTHATDRYSTRLMICNWERWRCCSERGNSLCLLNWHFSCWYLTQFLLFLTLCLAIPFSKAKNFNENLFFLMKYLNIFCPKMQEEEVDFTSCYLGVLQ